MSEYNLTESDKELLTLAAKAAGLRVVRWGEADEYYSHRDGEVAYRLKVDDEYDNGDFGYEWNPLTDDGDALCLVVSLGLMIAWDRWNGNDYVCIRHRDLDEEIGIQISTDRGEAVRRAIVMAAAEIGKGTA